MRSITIVFILFIIPEYLISQENYLDYLNRSYYSGGNADLERYNEFSHHLKSAYDSLSPLNVVYIDRYDKTRILHGYHEFTISSNLNDGSPHYVGITPLFTYGFGTSLEYSTPMVIKVRGCFDDGVPCNSWEYEITELNDDMSKPLYICKHEFYKNGLLEGDYIIRKKCREKGFNDVIYKTTFSKGTGYYKDYFPDGTLRMEGPLLNGYMDGQWIFYVYDDKEYQGIIVEKYEKGRLIRIPQKFLNGKVLNKNIRKVAQ